MRISRIVTLTVFCLVLPVLVQAEKKGKVAGYPILGRIKDCAELARKLFVDEIIVTIPSERETIGPLIKEAKSMHLGVRGTQRVAPRPTYPGR